MTTKINLLPPKLKAARRRNWGRGLVAAGVVAVMLAPVGYWGTLYWQTAEVERKTAEAKAEYAAFAPALAKDKQLQDMERSLADKRKFIKELNSPLKWAGMLHEITTYIPPTVVLDEMRALGAEESRPGQGAQGQGQANPAPAPSPQPQGENDLLDQGQAASGGQTSGSSQPAGAQPSSGAQPAGGTQAGVTIPSISDRFLMTGRAASLQAIGQFMVGIQNAKYLSSPELTYAVEEEGGFRFEIIATIRR